MLGVQNCWELKNNGSTKVLEYKNVGSSKMLGVQKCWELKNVGGTKMLGAQKCWEYKNVLQHFSPTKVKKGFSNALCSLRCCASARSTCFLYFNKVHVMQIVPFLEE